MEPWMTETRELAAAKPRKILFLCVQNSARSQMAEAIARHLAPTVTALSAGSSPAFVRPQVVHVLEEAGISSVGLYSKAVDGIAPEGLDAVITLCAEEVCPTFWGGARRLHWSLPDPAKPEQEEAKLDAFRLVRDELIRRLRVLFDLEGTP